MLRNLKPSKLTLFGAALAGMLIFGAGATVRADNREKEREKCERRIHQAEENLHKQVERHGEHSRQAEEARRRVEDARHDCHERDRDRDRDRH